MAETLMELVKRVTDKTLLKETLKEDLIPFEGDLPAQYYVVGGRELRDVVIAAKIAGSENLDTKYSLLKLGGVPRGRTLNLVREEYRGMWKAHKTFEAIGYRGIDSIEMLNEYRHTHGDEPECLLEVKPRYANRIYVVKESQNASGVYVMGSGVLLSDYDGEYEDSTMLAIGRPLLYDEVEYLPLET